MTYLEELLNKCDLLRVVINPPHPGAFIQGRSDQATILLAELEQEIAEIEKQDAPTFELISLQGKDGEWVGLEPSFYSQSQEWQQQDNEVDLWSDYGFSRGSFA